MREWLRLLARGGCRLRARRSPPSRRLAGRAPPRAEYLEGGRDADDFSLEVKEAMDGCLACKSCVGQCPIKVDVPAFRSRFLELYYGRYPAPAKDHLVAPLERMLPLMARTRALANAVTHSRLGRAAIAKLGLVALPALDRVDVERVLRARGVRMATPQALARIAADDSDTSSVVVVQDAFTLLLRLRRRARLLRAAARGSGFTPWLAPFRPNGKPQHVLGFLGEVRPHGRATMREC